MNRRDFLVVSAATGALTLLPSWAKAYSPDPKLIKNFTAEDLSPVTRLTALRGSNVIEGDTHDEAHEIFWNKEGYIQKKGGIPAPSAHYDVVIVGGGIAGLTAAYYLNNKKILLIDGHPRMGGNAKAQNAGKTWVGQGSAYLGDMEEGGEIDSFLSQLGIKKFGRKVDSEPVSINGKIFTKFWEGESDPSRAGDFVHVKKRLDQVFENEIPELPIWDSNRSNWDNLDRISFAEWIRREFGTVHPHIMELITLYCWSSFCSSPSEISAAHGIYFFVSDTCGHATAFPGGNGFVTQAIFEKLKTRSNVTMKGKAFAVDIVAKNGKAQICYKASESKLETVTATKCIVATPKLPMKFVISGLDPVQKKAMDDINYRAYLVANVMLKKKIPSRGYDMYTMKGKVPTNEYNDSRDRVYTDVIFADWAGRDNTTVTALTLYLPLPYDMAQQYLFLDGLYQKYEDRLKAALPETLSALGLSWADVDGWRLVRYGHSMPVAAVGKVADGTFERASKDIGGCIYFANQDNWGNPCFETAWKSAVEVAKKCK